MLIKAATGMGGASTMIPQASILLTLAIRIPVQGNTESRSTGNIDVSQIRLGHMLA